MQAGKFMSKLHLIQDKIYTFDEVIDEYKKLIEEKLMLKQ